MSQLQPLKQSNSEKLIWFFLLGWTLLNLVQAGTLGIHSDEAYYWIYSRFLDWGYYDHPPMVALFIRAGYTFFHNEFGVRLVTVIASTLAIRVLWLIARNYNTDARLFILVTGGIFIFHIYGFITTPDAPLFFFTTLFYYLYRKYLVEDKWPLALLLALTLAALLYSKYHAVLLIVFTIFANIKLLRRPSFWLIVVITALLYVPHIWWQISHGYPSVNYHLFERSSEVYDISHTYLFFPGQLLMAGPLIGWALFYLMSKVSVKDAFIRTLLVNCLGTLLFFFISTLKGNVQPHWTLIAFVPLAILALIYFSQNRVPLWFRGLAMVNLLLIVCIRLLLVSGIPTVRKVGAVKSFFGFDTWAQKIKQRAGNAYVIFQYGFQDPSKYNFYTHTLKGFSYDTRYYRRTQYELWPIEDSLQHHRVLFIAEKPDTTWITKWDSLQTGKDVFYTCWVDDARTYQKIDVKTDNYKMTARPNQPVTFHLNFTNPYPYTINFSNKDQRNTLYFGACFLQGDKMPYAQRCQPDFYEIQLKPHQSTSYTFTTNAPPLKGKYDVIFSFRTTPFPGGRNSRIINFTVK